MPTIHIYTVSNWHLIKYLFPKGQWVKGKYVVWLDDAITTKLNKVRSVSPWLADQLAVYCDDECVTFALHCDQERSK